MREVSIRYFFNLSFLLLLTLLCFSDIHIPGTSVRIIELFSILFIFCSVFVICKYGIPKLNPLYLLLFAPFFLYEISYPLLKFNLSGIRFIIYYITPYLMFYYYFNHLRKENFANNLKTIVKFFIVINFSMLCFQYLDRFSGLDIYKTIRLILSPFYNAEDTGFAGTRATGMFSNATGLAIAAYLVHLYLLSSKGVSKFWISLNLALIFFSGSRVVILCVLLSFVYLFFISKASKKLATILVLTLLCAILWYYNIFEYLNMFIERFSRLIEYGLLNDYSLNHRISTLWGPPIEYSLDRYYGTVYNPVQKFIVIDSGYITYFAQGGFPFLLVLFGFLAALLMKVIILRNEINSNFNVRFFAINLYVFLIIAMIISNPMRDYLVLFAIVFVILYPQHKHIKNLQS